MTQPDPKTAPQSDMVLVPRQPTEAMLIAAGCSTTGVTPRGGVDHMRRMLPKWWRAMLAASPTRDSDEVRVPTGMSEEVLDTLAERFCVAPLPDTVRSDLCATMDYPHPRYGTNLLSVAEAKEVLRFVMDHDILPLIAEGLGDHAWQERARMQIKAADRLCAAIAASSPPAQQAGVEDALRGALAEVLNAVDIWRAEHGDQPLAEFDQWEARARAALSNQDIGPPVYLGGAGLTAVEVEDIDTAGLSGGYGVGSAGEGEG